MASKKKPAKKPATKKPAAKKASRAKSAPAAAESKPEPKKELPPNPNPGWECLDINRPALIKFIVGTLVVAILAFIGMIPLLAGLTKAELKKGDSPVIALADASDPKSYGEQVEQYQELQKELGSYSGRDRLQPDPPSEIIVLEQSQEALLNSYGYNSNTKKARIPIAAAMEKLLSKGLKSGKPAAMVMTPELEAGKAIYMGAGACFSCHGNTGLGDGPAAVALNPKPRSFASGDYLYDTDNDGVKGSAVDLKNIMQFGTIKYGGSPLMPARPDIVGEDLENLVKFLQALKTE